MGRVVDRALNPQANVYLLDLDDVEEVGQYADQIAGLINMLIREQEDLHQALYEERGSVKGWNHQDVLHWVGKGKWFVVAIANDKVVGVAALQEENNDVRLNNFSVLKAFRGQGIGKSMVACMEKLVTDNTYGGIVLNVYPNNVKAMKLYEMLGFQPVRVTMRKAM
jgi:ribosomal protein S18 acetylase RimI-like enzyme